MRCRKETGMTVWAPSQRSLTTLIKYWGGMGSYMDTVKVTVCSSSMNLPLRIKISLCSVVSPSTSSTMMWKSSEAPCTWLSHWKSGVMVSSTLSTFRVIGCTEAESSSLGNWWMSLCTVLPIFGKRISSPISWGDMSKKRSQLSTSFFSSFLMISMGILENCLRGIMLPHILLSTILHRPRVRSVRLAHPLRSTISNRARMRRPALWVMYVMSAMRAKPSSFSCEM
mmetsp:Transcript_1320/g.3149  ORF Transcript_1320/g.3149 Transcript_1320/m.3149 type:complete len:226 (-) Transcript_1320:708-1385(-)